MAPRDCSGALPFSTCPPATTRVQATSFRLPLPGCVAAAGRSLHLGSQQPPPPLSHLSPHTILKPSLPPHHTLSSETLRRVGLPHLLCCSHPEAFTHALLGGNSSLSPFLNRADPDQDPDPRLSPDCRSSGPCLNPCHPRACMSFPTAAPSVEIYSEPRVSSEAF